MPFKTRDLALDTWLMMVSATCMLMGLAALLASVATVAGQVLLAVDAAVAALAAGLGLLGTLLRQPRLRGGAGILLGMVALFTVLHNGLVGDAASAAWGWQGSSLSSLGASLLLVISLCLMLGSSLRVLRRLWRLVGALLVGIGALLLGWLPGASEVTAIDREASSPLVVALFALLFGAAMLAASLRSMAGTPPLGRTAIVACLLGVGISSAAWYLLSWQQQARENARAEFVFDNIRLNAEQVMSSRLQLLRRLAERLNAAPSGLDRGVIDQDLAGQLRDLPSARAFGLLDVDGNWRWTRGRDLPDESWLSRQVRQADVQEWIRLPFPQPRMMVPDLERPMLALVVIAVPRHGQQLLAVMDMATLLERELRVPLGEFQVALRRQGDPVLQLAAPGVTPQPLAQSPRLVARHVGLPGGLMISPSIHPATRSPWPRAVGMPALIGLGGLTLSYLLALSLGLVRLSAERSRDLDRSRRHLLQQQEIQARIVEEAPLEESLEAVCGMLEEQLPGRLCSIMLADREEGYLRLAAGRSLPAAYRHRIRRILIGQGIGACGSAAHRREVVVCDDLPNDPAWQGYHELVKEHALIACWSYPIISSDTRLLGTFAVYSRYHARPTPLELEQMRQAVDIVALAVERDQDRHSLRESEQRYRSLFAYHPDAVFSLDLQGRFATANPHCASVTGFALEEILGGHFSRFVQADDLARIQSHFERSLRGEPCRYELEVLNRDGEPRRLDMTNLPIVVEERIQGVYGIAKDVTERQENEVRLRILERGIEASVNGVVIADACRPDMPMTYVNAAFLAMTGYRRDEVLGRNCRFLQGPDTDPQALQQLRDQLAAEQEVHVTLRNYRKDGEAFWNDLYISPILDDAGQVTHYVGIQHDISEHKAYEAQLAYHASHDALTGLGNRAMLEDRLAHDLALAARQGTRLGVMFIDLDEFKPINDSLGHAIGDRLLQQLARRLAQVLRRGDTLARFGGDEFVILLNGLKEEVQALEVAERLLELVARPYRIEGHELHLTASIGIAVSADDGTPPMELIQQADMAMYRAKQHGRNAYQWFTPEITARVGERVALRNELQDAIETDAFELHYQPLFGRDGEVVGMEALLRWHHPKRGDISPATFIPFAEQTGQIMPISRWVLSRACRDMEALRREGLTSLGVSVNLSPLQFHRGNFLTTLRETLRETGLPPGQLTLELTEGVLMNDTESAIDTLDALRGMGIRVAIDDFGTGYSSLSYLKNLPIDTVKIDRSFIHEIERNERDSAITLGIVSMAHHLGLKVVAEGIETPTQHRLVKEHGCDVFQGFLLARPMPLERLRAFLDVSAGVRA
ncbi:PAS domain S-box-containing protein/diguanylate cyclase (GGDEF) domain-containing protein [Halomonas shengliensis]|uniref:cyclic-guanylate-specific phosphodiesterase n=1 Tax=Halomonas shengliensis TaxID=419597 RepID=A0A1H0ETG8_9GAMM|nr:EAL domain-containing protein [Halomonas shengliensis]SDN85613.1 PAS domain S-box-containing protein/diguanylate cyclase (GGDEF) domain-containing protein [Halomonas shengliensis]